MVKKNTDPTKPKNKVKVKSVTKSSVGSGGTYKTAGYNSYKDYEGGAVPRVGGTAKKTQTSDLKAASKAQVKASKKFAVKPTVSKQMRKHSRGKR